MRKFLISVLASSMFILACKNQVKVNRAGGPCTYVTVVYNYTVISLLNDEDKQFLRLENEVTGDFEDVSLNEFYKFTDADSSMTVNSELLVGKQLKVTGKEITKGACSPFYITKIEF